jgi:hypothetical protein
MVGWRAPGFPPKSFVLYSFFCNIIMHYDVENTNIDSNINNINLTEDDEFIQFLFEDDEEEERRRYVIRVAAALVIAIILSPYDITPNISSIVTSPLVFKAEERCFAQPNVPRLNQ